jgi:hypothetical protein
VADAGKSKPNFILVSVADTADMPAMGLLAFCVNCYNIDYIKSWQASWSYPLRAGPSALAPLAAAPALADAFVQEQAIALSVD